MTSDKKWNNRSLDSVFTSVGAELSPTELEAEILDDGVIGDRYASDEGSIRQFDGLLYSKERREWIARFVPTHPERTPLTHSDGTYAEVLEFARLLHDCGVKPSQSFKALTAFGDRLDRTAKMLSTSSSYPPQTPAP